MDIKHIAKLARIGLTEGEEEKFEKELSGILGFVEKLQEVKTEKVKPTAQVTGLENVTREDKGKERSQEERAKLLEQAPEKKDDYVKVKTVL